MSKQKRERPPMLFDDLMVAQPETSPEAIAQDSPDLMDVADEATASAAVIEERVPFVPLRDQHFDPLPPVSPPVFREAQVDVTQQPASSPSMTPPPSSEKSRDAVDAQGMHPTALVFLDQPVARKLAVAWNLSLRTMADDEWMAIAGLEHTVEAKRICKALRAHHICRDGGVTDELAMRYITTIVAAPLQKAKAKAATK